MFLSSTAKRRPESASYNFGRIFDFFVISHDDVSAFNAEKVNEIFERKLQKIVARKHDDIVAAVFSTGVEMVYKLMVRDNDELLYIGVFAEVVNQIVDKRLAANRKQRLRKVFRKRNMRVA